MDVMLVTALSLSSLVCRSSSAVFAEIDGQSVALDMDRGVCFGLNGVATVIWNKLEASTAVSSLCEALLLEFAVDRATCEQQTLDLLEDLLAEGLITSDGTRSAG